MSGGDLAAPRFRNVSPGAGHYESFYVKARHPDRPRALWLRHTIHQRPGEERTASLWLTLFDADHTDPPQAGKQTFNGSALTPRAAGLELGPATLGPRRAHGRLESDTLTAEWDLSLDGDEGALEHLPASSLYDAPLPRTKALTPQPALRLSGALRAGPDDVDVDGWIGMVGHNWGSEHAERWIWLHAGQFDGHDERTWIDATLGRVRVGGRTTPWVANGALSIAGERLRIGGLRAVRSTRVDERATYARFILGGAEVRLEGELRSPPAHTVAWRYADPSGPEHHVAHSSVADLRLLVRQHGHPPLELLAPAAATYEIGMRETDHGLPLQPYADGEPAPTAAPRSPRT